MVPSNNRLSPCPSGLRVSPQSYERRRSRLKKDVGSGILLFLGNMEVGMNYADNTYRFRQDSSFLYFFGLDYAALAAVIDIDEDREIVFGNELTIDDIVWTGTQPTLHDKCEAMGIKDSRPMNELKTYLDQARRRGQHIHFLPPYRGDHQVWLWELLGLNPAEQNNSVSQRLVKAIVRQRIYKDEEEIAIIEEAVNISTQMHLAAYRKVRPGIHEAEVAAAVEEVACKGGNTLSFPTIATVKGQVLHNHGFIHTLKEGDIFLLDAGAETRMHYAGDLSSSMPVGERFTERQEIIYNIHLDSFRAAVDMLHPGVPFREAHLAAATKICEGMKSLGLMKGDPVEAAHIGAYALFFPCGLGHMMGLDVHNMENLGEEYVGYNEGEAKSTQFGFKSLRLARPLEPGFVFTVEPGIYFIPELIDKWEAEHQFTDFINYDKLGPWRDFTGLRNELDYVITTDGVRQLGTIKKPMTLEEVYAAKEA
ncbi:MAG: aminopeptidase P N-terminal domain-containing protein [Bacteroidaceae bacterium]|nr:aminopeptidase P N-terminal domain-containing protein [Bacteroidaceae bacterium]